MILYIEVETPNDRATHIKVRVSHSAKQVMLDVDPVVIKDQIIRQSFNMRCNRRSTMILAEMPRLAPKKLANWCNDVKSVIEDRVLTDHVWTMIREAAKDAGVTVPENEALKFQVNES